MLGGGAEDSTAIAVRKKRTFRPSAPVLVSSARRSHLRSTEVRGPSAVSRSKRMNFERLQLHPRAVQPDCELGSSQSFAISDRPLLLECTTDPTDGGLRPTVRFCFVGDCGLDFRLKPNQHGNKS